MRNTSSYGIHNEQFPYEMLSDIAPPYAPKQLAKVIPEKESDVFKAVVFDDVALVFCIIIPVLFWQSITTSL